MTCEDTDLDICLTPWPGSEEAYSVTKQIMISPSGFFFLDIHVSSSNYRGTHRMHYIVDICSTLCNWTCSLRKHTQCRFEWNSTNAKFFRFFECDEIYFHIDINKLPHLFDKCWHISICYRNNVITLHSTYIYQNLIIPNPHNGFCAE